MKSLLILGQDCITVKYEITVYTQPLATLKCDEANFLKMAAGQLDPTKAFMSGKLKIKGDMTMGSYPL